MITDDPPANAANATGNRPRSWMGRLRVDQTENMTRTETAWGAAGAVIAGRRIELLDRARVYACGITPYDVTHLGHAATFVWIDTLGRVLRLLGVQPEVCRNVTDVDDVLDAAAGRAGAAYDEFAAVQQLDPLARDHSPVPGRGGLDSGHVPSLIHPGHPRRRPAHDHGRLPRDVQRAIVRDHREEDSGDP